MDQAEMRKVVESFRPGDKFTITLTDEATNNDIRPVISGLLILDTARHIEVISPRLHDIQASLVTKGDDQQRVSPTIELVAGAEFSADWFCQLLLQDLEEVKLAS